jgi:uncharacterized protein YceK
MRKLCIATFIFLLIIIFSGCSTVLNSTTQEVELKTTPANAKVTIDGKKFGTTPQVVNIDRGSNHTVKFDFDGFESYEIQLTRKISFWFWGNALNGFIPGMLIDMFTGSMYNLLPEKVEIELTPAKVEQKKK